MASKLIGRTAYITDKRSIYYGEWGIIIDKDEDDLYYIAIANGMNYAEKILFLMHLELRMRYEKN